MPHTPGWCGPDWATPIFLSSNSSLNNLTKCDAAGKNNKNRSKFASAGDAADDPQKQTREQQGHRNQGRVEAHHKGTQGYKVHKSVVHKNVCTNTSKITEWRTVALQIFKIIRPTPHHQTQLSPDRIWILLVHAPQKTALQTQGSCSCNAVADVP